MDNEASTAVDTSAVSAVRECLDAATGVPAVQALPHLRTAAERLIALLDETMAVAVVSGEVSLRTAGQRAGMSENSVGPRLARTRTLGAYANPQGRVTAEGVTRARYDHETGSLKPAPEDTSTPMRFKPRRTT